MTCQWPQWPAASTSNCNLLSNGIDPNKGALCSYVLPAKPMTFSEKIVRNSRRKKKWRTKMATKGQKNHSDKHTLHVNLVGNYHQKETC